MPYGPDDVEDQPALGLGQDQPVISESDTAHLPTGPDQELSHALRTRLAIITLLSGNLDLLYERLDDEKRRAMIRDLRKHTRALNDLASDLLLQRS